MTKRFSLAFKLPAMVVAIALVTGAGLAISAYFVSDAIVSNQAEQRLTSGAANATAALDAYLEEVERDLTLFAGRSDIAASIDAFSGAYNSLKGQGEPSADDVDEMWRQVNELRTGMARSMHPVRRLRAAVSPKSLLSGRRVRSTQ